MYFQKLCSLKEYYKLLGKIVTEIFFFFYIFDLDCSSCKKHFDGGCILII
jgi:hypothetical protein